MWGRFGFEVCNHPRGGLGEGGTRQVRTSFIGGLQVLRSGSPEDCHNGPQNGPNSPSLWCRVRCRAKWVLDTAMAGPMGHEHRPGVSGWYTRRAVVPTPGVPVGWEAKRGEKPAGKLNCGLCKTVRRSAVLARLAIGYLCSGTANTCQPSKCLIWGGGVLKGVLPVAPFWSSGRTKGLGGGAYRPCLVAVNQTLQLC